MASKLKDLLVEMNFNYPENPCIEVNGLYEGIRIRKITYLTDKQREELIRKADVIYEEIMGLN